MAQQPPYPPRGGMQVLVEPVPPRFDVPVWLPNHPQHPAAGGSWSVRPGRETGTRGLPVLLYSNAFKISSPGKRGFEPSENACWYKYQVTILPTRQRAAAALSPPLPPKQLLRKIWAKLEETERNGVTSLLGGVLAVYDGRSACYTTRLYPDSVISTTVTLPDRGTFSLAITNPIEIKVYELKKWWQRQSAEQSHVAEALAALNTLWVHGLSTAFLAPANRTTTFIGRPEAESMGVGREHSPKWIGGGLELWRGFFQSIKLTPTGPALNGDTTSGVFIRSGSLQTVALDFLDSRNSNHLNASVMDERQKIRLRRFLTNLNIDIFPHNHVKHKRAVKIRGGITDTSARDTYFTLRETNETVSVEEYFLRDFNIRLQYPDLPCVVVKAGVNYPMELCSVTVGNKYRRKLNAAQQKNASAFQVLKPEARFEFLRKLLNDGTLLPNGQPAPVFGPLPAHMGPYLAEFGLEIGGRLKLKGRQLLPPGIKYRQSGASVTRGAWRMTKGRDQFALAKGFISYAIIIANPRDEGDLRSFFPALIDAMREFGMTLDFPSDHHAVVHMREDETPEKDCESAVDSAYQRALQVFGKPPQVIFCVFKIANDPRYNIFKAEGARRGVATQAMQTTLLKKGGDLQTLINVGMKVNAKLGGVNFLHTAGTTSGDEPNLRRRGYLEDHPAIVFGADLSDSPGKPSIAAVVASMDTHYMLSADAVSVQRLIEPPTNAIDARAKKDEIIGDLSNMVFNLLKRRSTFGNGPPVPPPDTVIFFRDGVSDGEFGALITREIPAIKQAFKRMQAEFPSWSPRLTYLTCAKRHHIRLIPSDEKNSEKTKNGQVPKVIGNAPAGTVVDTQIVDPRSKPFQTA
ncbi:hypothetical protein RQP46_009299 [Phenoliferia psychrophenolica]